MTTPNIKAVLQIAILKAALECAGKQDVRYYLNGVCLQIKKDTFNYISTDGTILFASAEPSQYEPDSPAVSDLEIIIPRDEISIAIKGKKEAHITLEHLGGVTWILGSVRFSPIDHSFPDYMRVIPESVSGEPGNYQPELLQKVFKAIDIANGGAGSKFFSARLNQNGLRSSGVVTGMNPKTIAIIMPVELDKRKEVIPKYTGWKNVSPVEAGLV